MIAPKEIKRVVIFGGAGLVGFQIARQVAREFKPEKIVICALYKEEIDPAISNLKKEFPEIKEIVGEYGNIFVRSEYAQKGRGEIASDPVALQRIFNDVFDNITDDKDNVGQQNLMSQIIVNHKPDAVIDCVNTATGISYQDVKSSSLVVKDFKNQMSELFFGNAGKSLKEAVAKAESGDKDSTKKVVAFAKSMIGLVKSPLESFPDLNNVGMLDQLLVSQAVPQLVRHVTLLHRALIAAGSQVYVKVGTTGTGGMGVNIPYTHGEDKPSFTLMAKTSVGFAHTGLLFLLARSPGPIIKEIKPGAMIGYRKVDFRPIKKFGQQIKKWESKKQTIGKSIQLREDVGSYSDNGDLELVGIDTGENGFFTCAEFEAITYLGQMEFVTPEEIARNVLYEICGDNTGKDVIAAIDGSVMDPSYRGGYIRQDAIDVMRAMEDTKGIPSIAIGALGPPQLSKFLYESHLLQRFFPTVLELASDNVSAKDISDKLANYIVEHESVQNLMTSLGLTILLPDGKSILRGPSMNIPESKVHASIEVSSDSDIDEWAKQGWVDLREENMKVWKSRAGKMLASQSSINHEGSAGYSQETYLKKELIPGEAVGWIFINELGGNRGK